MSVRTSESHDEQVGIVGAALYLNVGYGYLGNLLGAQVAHQVMVLRVGGDGTRPAVFLQSAQDVHVAFASGDGPVAYTGFGVAAVGCIVVLHFGGGIRRVDGGIFGQLGQLPGPRAVGHVAVGQQYDGRHVLQSNLAGHIGCVEAVGGRCGGNDRHGAFAVAAEEGLQQVGLFRLGRQTGRGAAALYVEYDKGQLGDDGQVHGFGLQADAGARGGGYGQCTGKRSADGGGAT